MGSDSKTSNYNTLSRSDMTMKSRLWIFLFLTATVVVMLSTSQEATGEADPFVDEVLYLSLIRI